jgi:hypothetical protein
MTDPTSIHEVRVSQDQARELAGIVKQEVLGELQERRYADRMESTYRNKKMWERAIWISAATCVTVFAASFAVSSWHREKPSDLSDAMAQIKQMEMSASESRRNLEMLAGRVDAIEKAGNGRDMARQITDLTARVEDLRKQVQLIEQKLQIKETGDVPSSKAPFHELKN